MYSGHLSRVRRRTRKKKHRVREKELPSRRYTHNEWDRWAHSPELCCVDACITCSCIILKSRRWLWRLRRRWRRRFIAFSGGWNVIFPEFNLRVLCFYRNRYYYNYCYYKTYERRAFGALSPAKPPVIVFVFHPPERSKKKNNKSERLPDTFSDVCAADGHFVYSLLLFTSFTAPVLHTSISVRREFHLWSQFSRRALHTAASHCTVAAAAAARRIFFFIRRPTAAAASVFYCI